MRILSLIVAAVFAAAPAFAHDSVHIENAYARTNGGIGASGAVFMEITNHADVADRLISAASDVADKVELHTHKAGADGVMQMMAVPEGFPIDALMSHALARGGDHVMLMGLKQDLKDGDMVHLSLTFEHAGVVEVDVAIDNARKPAGEAMNHDAHAAHKGHGMAGMIDTTGMSDVDAITAIMKAQFDTPENPLSVDPVVIEGDAALASWAQGDKGGRALLARHDGKWQITLCGGADLRMPEFLGKHGVSAAETLSQMFNDAEDKLGAEKVTLSSSFEGVVMITEHGSN